jgi:hypothetical protein
MADKRVTEKTGLDRARLDYYDVNAIADFEKITGKGGVDLSGPGLRARERKGVWSLEGGLRQTCV